jgi:hypothetical protein
MRAAAAARIVVALGNIDATETGHHRLAGDTPA